ncbi:MAG: sigma-70 family RNA polymerase sigma factor [Chloroflexota bacterium]
MPNVRLDGTRTDEDLMLELARGQQEALGPLYSRYARLVFNLSAQSLGRAGAEELVQEVFLTIWRGAGGFDAAQAPFRPWLLRLTHWKILNELRRRRRRPAEQPGDSDDANASLEHVRDAEPGPKERAWQNQQGQVLRAALQGLPPKQRQALALAYLDDLTHEQVAQALHVPLGTAKTRIRSGLQILRLRLAPMAASLLGVALTVVGVRYLQSQVAYERDERALRLVTTSELVPLRLTPASADVPATAHANYRGRAGNTLIVLTAEGLPAPPVGRTYQAWVRHADRWTALGTLVPSADGSARLIAESPELASPPDAVEITLEPDTGSPTSSAPAVLVWPNS